MISIQIYPDVAAVAKAAAYLLYERMRAADRRLMVALSGGSTPKAVYRELTSLPEASQVLKEKGEFFFSDERAVGPESEQSNYRTAKFGLFKPLGIDATHVHRIRGEEPELAAEAVRYEELIRRQCGGETTGVPRFDLILLGMGPDGHTASLFPEYDFTVEQSSLVAAPYVQSMRSYRVTFTVPLINASRAVLCIVTGADKATAVKKVLSTEVEGDILPARRVEAEETVWLLDAAAAAQLDPVQTRGTVRLC